MTREQLKDYGIKVTQANGTELVKLTLELAAEYVGEAEKSVDDIDLFTARINKARAFIAHLISSLNMQYEISSQLLNIYLYLNSELLKAGIKGDATLLPRFRGILLSLSEAFGEICKEDTNGPVMENAEPVYVGLTYSKGKLNESTYIGEKSRGFTVSLFLFYSISAGISTLDSFARSKRNIYLFCTEFSSYILLSIKYGSRA